MRIYPRLLCISQNFEFTTPYCTGFDKRTMKLSDIHMFKHHLTIHLSSSKCDQFQSGCTIKLAATDRSICAFISLQRFFRYRKQYSKKSNLTLFTFGDGYFQNKSKLNGAFKTGLRGLKNANSYTAHFFRIGGPALQPKTMDHETIQRAERSKSKCFASYIRRRIPALGLDPYKISWFVGNCFLFGVYLFVAFTLMQWLTRCRRNLPYALLQ